MQLEPEQKKRIFLYILGALGAALMIIAAVIVSLGKGDADTPGVLRSEVSIPEDELLVSDNYEGSRLIPKFNLPPNKYKIEKFIEKDGFLRYDAADARLGVDVSEYQGDIDWAQVKSAGIDFAILRLGYRGTTQGLLNVDERFEQNFTGAADAGLSVGVYFFSQAVSAAEAVAEADFVIETLNGRKTDYPVVFDWEQPIPSEQLPAELLRAYDMDGELITECAVAFCRRIKEAGYTPCVYTNKHLAYDFFDLEQWADYDIWYAEYQNAPSLYYDFRIWQYTDSGTVPGIDGGVDMNICFKNY